MKIFQNEVFGCIRVVVNRKESWFVAKDISQVLGYGKASYAVRYLDEDEKGVMNQHTLGGQQELTIINESGLYSLILRSRRPEAKQFKKWITQEVLPSIRKTGEYRLPNLVTIKEIKESYRLFRLALNIAKEIFSRHKALYSANEAVKRDTGLDILEKLGAVPLQLKAPPKNKPKN
ncbi:MAG: Bro-N domain-containing protein [Candidatus Margulisbacteria bacterium]|nr:Bro-N domain-containing protein [Candidatus Margulisiibacteriota bacterium]